MFEQQHFEVCNLRQNCQQAEDALSQGMEKLHYIVAEAIGAGRLGEGNYLPQISAATEKLEALVRFVGQVISCAFLCLQLFVDNFETFRVCLVSFSTPPFPSP